MASCALDWADPGSSTCDVVVGADLVYALAPSTSMGGAFRDVGASDATTRLLVCAVASTVHDFRELVERVDGRRVPLSALDARSAAAQEALVSRFGLSADEKSDVERAVLTKLATKDLLKGGGVRLELWFV